MPENPVDPQKDKTTTPSQSVGGESPHGDDVLREDWKKLSEADKTNYFQSLPASEQDQFAKRVGLFESKLPISITAHPQADWKDMLSPSPIARAAGIAQSIPWMKQKAYSILNWTANQLPTVGGVGGGIAGGAVGTAVNPVGGEVPGAVIGSGLGGSAGEAARQFIVDKANLDPFAEPKTKTQRVKEIAKEGAGQAAGEVFGRLGGKLLRPTLERSLSKLYYAGGLKYGDPLGGGDLEKVIHDVIATEKAGAKATTVGDFIGVINETKKDIGQQVDLQLALPTKQNGRTVMLGQAMANPTEIVNAITSKATDSPSIMKMAKVNPAGKEAVYLEKIRREALAFQQHPWTYAELTDRRIHLNQELAPIYSLPPGEQRVYLLEHPDLAYKKAEAEAIRDTVYPMMDHLSGKPKGTTLALQEKRGALMSLENQINDHLSKIKTAARQAQGAPPLEKVNISSYGTTGGKPGLAVHRLTGLVHTPNPERTADRQVAKAFGNTVGSKVRGVVSTPLGSEKLGNELLSMPLREIVNPAMPKKPEDQDGPGPQSSVATPKELREKAKQLNPSASRQTAYAHTAVNPSNGHRIGSRDGLTWFDEQTGAKVA